MARAARVDAARVDLAAFEAWLRSQLAGHAFASVVTMVLQIVRALFEQNTQLRQRLQARRAKPPSERLDAVKSQLAFGFTVPANDVHAGNAPAPVSAPAKKPRGRHSGASGTPRTRQPIPTTIPIVPVPNDVPDDQRQCTSCHCAMRTVDHRTVRYFELVPACLVLHVRHDETIACPSCDRIVCATAPPGILDGGTLGTTLVCDALCNKLLDQSPIERQARAFQRQGVPISASTLGRSVSALLALLERLAERITARIKQCERVQFDSTGLRVLDPTAMGGIHRHTLWTCIGDGRWVRFAALHDGDSDSIEAFLADAEAQVFQCDGTSVTNFVETKWKRVRAGCHAHARRKLVEAVRCGDLRAMDALNLYTKLFAIEKKATRLRLDPGARRAMRQRESTIVLEEIREWALAIAPSVEPKSVLGTALTYLQRQWFRLCVFLDDGAVELTNNRSERELRPWVLGQHSWLFVGNPAHAGRWAAAFSLVHTALAHGVNPRAYLHAIVGKLIAGHSHTRLDELLPDAMLRANPDLAIPRPETCAGEHEPRAA